MQENFQKGIEKPFLILKAINIESDLKSLQTYYYIHTILADIKRDIMENDLHDVFLCPFKFDDNGVPNTSDYLNLLDVIGALKIETVEKATALYKLKYPHKYNFQNIVWSGDKILNFCENKLH